MFAQFTFIYDRSKRERDFIYTREKLISGRISKLVSYIESRLPVTAFPGETLHDDWSDYARTRLSRTLGNAIDIAANLAFTDWATHVKTLSVRRFYGGEEPSWKVPGGTVSTDRAITNFLDVVPIITDSFQPPTLARGVSRLDWAGVDLDGLVVLNSTLIHRSLEELRGCALQLRFGRINYED
ncbi:hypothetical protein MMC30_002513 [Trapelia coarctata]|nr:hypothetical protein [Trapelia coarctata]